MNNITKEQWIDWKHHEVTQEFVRALKENRYARMEEVAEGKVEGNELYLEIGRIQGIKDAVEYALINFEHIQEDYNDEAVTE